MKKRINRSLSRFEDIWEDIPSDFVQEIARSYCEDRPLFRPRVSYWGILIKWSIVMLVSFFAYYFALRFLSLWVIPRFLSGSLIASLLVNLKETSFFLIPFLATCISLCFFLRFLVIDCIKLYQRYAPEHIRRRCILMPSCSTFAILAIRKYGLVFGCILTKYRLDHRCKGTINRIEYP